MRYLAFTIGDRACAIPVPQTEGIVPSIPVRPVPGLRPVFGGIVHWHGVLVPVVRFDRGIPGGQMIILRTRRGPLALEATGILGIHPDAAVDRQAPASPDSPHYLAGEAVIGGKKHALLDAEGVAEWAAGS